MRFGSLFCGIGGFDLGLERAGMECAWQVEIDPYAQQVLAKHWPDVRRHADVCTFPPQEGDWQVDVICGGFPCQDISYAGKGAGLAGERSGLWHQFARIIGELRPRYVIVENVAALLTRGMGEVLGTLASLGYDAEWHVIPASAVGAPHRRDRVWIVAFHANSLHDRAEREVQEKDSDSAGVRKAVADSDSSIRVGAGEQADAQRPDANRSGSHRTEVNLVGGVELRHKQERFAGSVGDNVPDANRRQVRGVNADTGDGGSLSQEESQRIVCGSDGGNDVADADNIRSEHLVCDIGEQEWKEQEADLSCGRSEGFNRDWWATEPNVGRVAHGVPSRVDRLRCLGNAVVPQVVELIGRAILQHEKANR